MASPSLLAALKDELAFFETGGYGNRFRSSWRPTLVLRDSPTCLNSRSATTKPCKECVLFSLVPEDKRHWLMPCHQIPLNADGETISSLYSTASQQKLDETFHHWLRATIQKLEEREATP